MKKSSSTEKPTENKNNPKVTGGICLLLFIIALITIGVMSCISKDDSSNKISTPTPTPIKSMGVEAKIHVDNISFVYAAADKDSAKQLNNRLLANDNVGISELVVGGKVFQVENDIKIKILDVDVWNGLYQVRFLEGKNINRSGWVSEGFVK